MADWSLPLTTSDYATVVLPALAAKDVDAGTLFYAAPTNQPDHSIRWNRANSKFEEWSTGGAAWSALAVSTGLGLGTMSTQNSNAVTITGGTVSATDLTSVAGLKVTGVHSGLPATTNASLNISGPSGGDIGKIYIGDGTGFNLRFASRSASVDTNRITFSDQGTITAVNVGANLQGQISTILSDGNNSAPTLAVGLTTTVECFNVASFNASSGKAYVGWNLRASSNALDTSKYVVSDFATKLEGHGGAFNFYTAPSGVAGNVITWTSAMKIHNSTGVSVGDLTDPGATNFRVAGTSALVGAVTITGLLTTNGGITDTGNVQVTGNVTSNGTVQGTTLTSTGSVICTTVSASNPVPLIGVNVGSSAGTTAVWNGSNHLQKLTSSARYKRDINSWPIPDEQLNEFLAASPKFWNYKGEQVGAIGFISEDLHALSLHNPYGRSPLLNYDRDGQPESNRDFALIALQHLILQRQAKRIASLEERLTILENRWS